MASLSDILTTAQNLVQAVNSLSDTIFRVQGAQVATDLSAETLVKNTPGRVANVSVLVAGSAAGAIYDAAALGLTTNALYVIPMTVGVVTVNLPANYGILVAPGTGQSVTVSYS